MKTRTDLLNHLIKKNDLKSYLEIGVQNPDQNFNKIECDFRISVDPDPKANADWIMTSDQFFRQHSQTINQFKIEGKFDLIFIDGLHTAEQVRKDFTNALKILSPNGFIVMHDCNPLLEEHTIVPRPTKTGHWNGDVYRWAVQIACNESYHTVDIDNGCGVYRNIPGSPAKFEDIKVYSFEFFDQYRNDLIKLISWDEFTMLP